MTMETLKNQIDKIQKYGLVMTRRVRMDLWSTAEKEIRQAIREVEEMGCDTLLTDAIDLLLKAQNIVADYIDKQQKKVFLGGTCNGSKWRETLINQIKISYYNPVVSDWTPDCQAQEEKAKKECDYLLYVITPLMTGVYSIAEVVDSSNKNPHKTLFTYLLEDENEHGYKIKFTEGQIRSLEAVGRMVLGNGGHWLFGDISEIAKWINSEIS